MTSPPPQIEALDPLAEHPNFTCRFPSYGREDEDEIINIVQAYFLERWPFPSEKEKRAYVALNVEPWVMHLIYGVPRDRAELFALWVTFWFIYDDLVEDMPTEEARNSVSRIVRIMSATNVPEDMDGVEKILHELTFRVREEPSTINGFRELGEHFIHTTCQYIESAGFKAQRMESFKHGLINYLDYRMPEIGGWFCLQGQFWSRGIVFSPRMLSDPDIYCLEENTLMHFVLANDLYSYRKERKHLMEEKKASGNSQGGIEDGFTMFNSITLFLDYYHMSPSDAIRECKRDLYSCEDRFLATLEQVKKKYSGSAEDMEIIDRASNAMMEFMGGNVVWSKSCVRYNSA